MTRGHGAKKLALFVAILNVYGALTGCALLGGLGGGCKKKGAEQQPAPAGQGAPAPEAAQPAVDPNGAGLAQPGNGIGDLAQNAGQGGAGANPFPNDPGLAGPRVGLNGPAIPDAPQQFPGTGPQIALQPQKPQIPTTFADGTKIPPATPGGGDPKIERPRPIEPPKVTAPPAKPPVASKPQVPVTPTAPKPVVPRQPVTVKKPTEPAPVKYPPPPLFTPPPYAQLPGQAPAPRPGVHPLTIGGKPIALEPSTKNNLDVPADQYDRSKGNPAAIVYGQLPQSGSALGLDYCNTYSTGKWLADADKYLIEKRNATIEMPIQVKSYSVGDIVVIYNKLGWPVHSAKVYGFDSSGQPVFAQRDGPSPIHLVNYAYLNTYSGTKRLLRTPNQ